MSTSTPWAETHAPFTCPEAKMLWPWRHTLEQQRIKWTSPGAYLRSEKRKRWEREYAAAQRVQWMHDTLMELSELHEAVNAAHADYFPEIQQAYDQVIDQVHAYAAHHNAQKP